MGYNCIPEDKRARTNTVRTFPLEILQSTRRSWGMLFLCYSNGMDHLVHTFIDTVTLFLSHNDQLSVNQSGFSSGHSNEPALLSVTVALQIEKADSKSSVLILLDLSATFDTVNHQIILSTITGSALHWFESYLTGRSFRVSWGGQVSKEHQLATGFPRGSVLHHIKVHLNKLECHEKVFFFL